jgi:hypothetical protein
VRREDDFTRLNGSFSHNVGGKEGRRTIDPGSDTTLPSVPQPERLRSSLLSQSWIQ